MVERNTIRGAQLLLVQLVGAALKATSESGMRWFLALGVLAAVMTTVWH